jgi:hypothetical protein
VRINVKRWKKSGPILLCMALFVMAGGFESASQKIGVQEGYLVPHVSGNAALEEAAGEFRIVIANILWSKVVDHYHHVFMAQGGDWSKNTSLLPLLHTITELDPHFTEAYQLEGGTILPRTGHLAQGQAVLAEGLRNNPNDWEMYREMAMLFAWTERKPALALPYAEGGLAQIMQSNARGEMQPGDYLFAEHLMTLLCHTLQGQIAHRPPITASGRLSPAPTAPASAVAAGPLPPATG